VGEPLVCRLDALTVEERARHAELAAEMKRAALGVADLADGWVLRFTDERRLFLRIAEWITLERLCCPFLDFALAPARGVGEASLRLTGGEGVKQFLKEELGLENPSEETR
jgi:hypothetical protein